MWQIRDEKAKDAEEIEQLVIACFGAGRFAKTAYRLREEAQPVPGLSFVATDNESLKLLGSVRFTIINIGETPTLLLGPLAILPELRGKGIGISLMQRGTEEARARGHESVILVGDVPYYSKVGFVQIPPRRISMPGPVDPARLLGLSLKPGALEKLSGEVRRASIDIPVSAHATPLS
jgi:predicted N-acetyltransferase YhbS